MGRVKISLPVAALLLKLFTLATILSYNCLAQRADREKSEKSGENPYPKYILEKIIIKGNYKTADSIILYFIPFKKGDVFSPDDPILEQSRGKLLATGWFSDVSFTLKKGSKKGRVILKVKVTERSTLLIRNLTIGVSNITTYGGVEIAEHNFLGRGLLLSGSLVAGKPYRGYKGQLLIPNINASPISIEASTYFLSGIDYLGYEDVVAIYPDSAEAIRKPARIDFKRIGGSLAGSIEITKFFNFSLKCRFEYIDAILPTTASHSRGGISTPIEFGLLPGKSYVSVLSASLTYDSRNDPFLPSSGTLLSANVEISNSIFGSRYNFSKYTVFLEYFKKLPWKHVARIGFSAGLITGEAPLFEKFYIGDLSDLIPGRILGMAFDTRKSFNLFRTCINTMRYEDIAGKLYMEYSIPLYRKKKGVYGIDFFIRAGLFLLASAQDLILAPEGYEEYSSIPVDFTGNIGFRFDTTGGFFEISMGTLLALIPIEEELTIW